MNKIPLIATGINGLVGSRFTDLFGSKYQITSLDLRDPVQPVDITNLEQVLKAISSSKAKSVVHLAAYTDLNAAWEQRGDKQGLAYQVNVEGTRNIVEACEKTSKYLIHISTAYVFDGENEAMYSEDDAPQPIEWYGQTKWEAEQIVMSSSSNWSILRIDQPFGPNDFIKKDVAHKIIDGLLTNTLPPQFSNQFFGPTYLDDFAKVLDFFIESQVEGLFHASSGEKWSPFHFATLIKKQLKLKGKIVEGNLNKYLKTLNRPYQKNTAMSCAKLQNIINFRMKSVEKAVSKFQSLKKNNRDRINQT